MNLKAASIILLKRFAQTIIGTIISAICLFMPIQIVTALSEGIIPIHLLTFFFTSVLLGALASVSCVVSAHFILITDVEVRNYTR